MCDYSLQNVKSRPAQVGDKLTVRYFGTGTRGFSASGRCERGSLPIARHRVVVRRRGRRLSTVALEQNSQTQDRDLPASER